MSAIPPRKRTFGLSRSCPLWLKSGHCPHCAKSGHDSMMQKHEPASRRVVTVMVDSLKALDPNRPIEKGTKLGRRVMSASCK